MRTVIKEYKIYKFEEASRDLKDKIIDNLSSYLYDHCMQERIETLKAFAKAIDGKLDYSISCVPDRGEHITIKPTHDDFNYAHLFELVLKIDDCPLTGCTYDIDLLEHLVKPFLSADSIKTALNEYLKSIHSEYEAMLGDDYISDLCEANDYEFYESGKIA